MDFSFLSLLELIKLAWEQILANKAKTVAVNCCEKLCGV